MRIAVVDGQGGGIGKSLVEKIKARYKDQVDVIALGTNAVATSLMIRGGADDGASGENAIIVNAKKVDLIGKNFLFIDYHLIKKFIYNFSLYFKYSTKKNEGQYIVKP